MKIPPFAFLKMLPAMLTLITCAKDKDENYTDEDQDYIEVQYGKHETVTKAMAIEDWELFLKQAHTSFLLTESNLNSLQAMIDEASGNEKQQLRAKQTSAVNRLNHLKKALEDRNAAFDNELDQYSERVQQKNEAFKKQFKRDLFDVNLELENVIEQ